MPIHKDNLEQYLAVGVGAVVQLGSAKLLDSVRHRTFVRGWRSGESLLLDLPESLGQSVSLVPDAPCVIRFVSSGMAFGFNTHILGWDTRKINPEIIIAWPIHCQHLRVRKSERIEVLIPCTVEHANGQRCSGEIHDISGHGCKILLPDELEVGSQFKLTFTLPDGMAIQAITAHVKGKQSRDCGASTLYGCQFDSGDQEKIGAVEFFVMTTIERTRGRAPGNRRLLYIGQDNSFFFPLQWLLEKDAFEMLSTSSVMDGFFRLRMTRLDGVMIQHDLHEMPGTDICRIIRKTPGFEHFPIFICGGDGDTFDIDAKQAGADAAFASTTETEKMKQTVTRLIPQPTTPAES